MTEEEELRRQLEEARATVASQATELRVLEEQAKQRSGLPALRELLQLADVVEMTVGQAPYRALLHGIVQAASRLFDAGASSILLLDQKTNELVFAAATSGDVLDLRIPATQGIAGWVLMTGEPIAVSDVRRDPRWAKDFAQSTGYIPQSIMAVPLMAEEDPVGVLEVLDKHANASFGLDDMELLGLFAQPAAIAVEQARLVSEIGQLLVQELGRLAEERGEPDLAAVAHEALREETAGPERTLELARLVHQISMRGERARELAYQILNNIQRYSG